MISNDQPQMERPTSKLEHAANTVNESAVQSDRLSSRLIALRDKLDGPTPVAGADGSAKNRDPNGMMDHINDRASATLTNIEAAHQILSDIEGLL